jgi:hypothetical protein
MITFFLVFSGFQPNDRKARRLQKEKETFELIESGRFRFTASSAKSSLGNFNNLGVTYDLVFDSLKLKAYLPYFGRAYSVPYGGSDGVKFDITAEKIETVWNEKKKLYTISAEVADNKDSYLIYLTTGLSGYADLRITFRNRQPISYYGTIGEIK